METLNYLGQGFGVAMTPTNLITALIGTLIGTIVGLLPGLGPINGVALLIPVAFALGLPPETALILLAAVYLGCEYGGGGGAAPPAVLAAQVHGGEQDQRGFRRQAEGEGHRDQQCHAVDRTEAWQQAYDGADQGADQRGDQVGRRHRDAEALAEVVQGFHHEVLTAAGSRERPAAAGRPGRGRTASRGRSRAGSR